jgi:hypothetical protein
MNWFKRKKIDFDRKLFLVKEKRREKRLLKKKIDAIRRADQLCEIDGKRRYVFFLDDRYQILSTIDMNEINKMLPKGQRWDIRRIMNEVVYKTR